MRITEPVYARRPHSKPPTQYDYQSNCYIDCCDEHHHYHRAIGIHHESEHSWTLVYECEGRLWHCAWAKNQDYY